MFLSEAVLFFAFGFTTSNNGDVCSTGIPIKLQTLSLLTKLQTRALKKYFDPSKIVENKQQPSKTWVKAFCEWKDTHYVIEKEAKKKFDDDNDN